MQQVGDDVPVQEHRAFGNAGGSARVLQESEVIVIECYLLELTASALGKRLGKPHRPGHTPRRDHLLHMAQREVYEQALPSKHLTDTGDDHLLDWRLADDFGDGVREIFDDNDDFGTAVA